MSTYKSILFIVEKTASTVSYIMLGNTNSSLFQETHPEYNWNEMSRNLNIIRVKDLNKEKSEIFIKLLFKQGINGIK